MAGWAARAAELFGPAVHIPSVAGERHGNSVSVAVAGWASDRSSAAKHGLVPLLVDEPAANKVELLSHSEATGQAQLVGQRGESAFYPAFVPWEEKLQAIALVLAGRGADDLALLAVHDRIATLKRLV